MAIFAGALVAALQKPVLSHGLPWLVKAGCASRGFDFEVAESHAGFFRPWVLGGVTVRGRGDSAEATALTAERLEVVWSSAGDILWNGAGLVQEIRVSKAFKRLNLRSPESVAEESARQRLSWLALAGFFRNRWPSVIEARDATIEILTNNARIVADDCRILLDNRRAGELHIRSVTHQSAGRTTKAGPFTGATSWKDGVAGLSGMGLGPDLELVQASLAWSSQATASLSMRFKALDGQLRVDASADAIQRTWDVVAMASRFRLKHLAGQGVMPPGLDGEIAEGRLTYRGNLTRPMDAEASLRLTVRDFTGGKMAWQSLTMGVNLIHRRLLVSECELVQKDNTVSLNGEISLAEGWSKFSDAPFLANIRARINHLGSLAGLLGFGDGEAEGRLTAEGSVSGRSGRYDGFLGVRGESLRVRGVPFEQLAVELLFRKRQILVSKCEVRSGRDSIAATGEVSTEAPHSYRADVNAAVANAATYLRLLPSVHPWGASTGAFQASWKGRGDSRRHSGNFEARAEQLKTPLTPAGVSGVFQGDYEPGRVRFSEFTLNNADLKLAGSIEIFPDEVRCGETKVEASGKPLVVFSGVAPLRARSIFLPGAGEPLLSDRSFDLLAHTPSQVDLSQLLSLAGQSIPLSGMVEFQARAKGTMPAVETSLVIAGRDLRYGPGDSASAALSFEATTKNGTLGASGSLTGASISLRLRHAHGVLNTPARWISSQRILDGSREAGLDLVCEHWDLSKVPLPDWSGLRGSVQGWWFVSGTPDQALHEGRLHLADGAFDHPSLPAPLSDVRATVVLDSARLAVEHAEGLMGAGSWHFSAEKAPLGWSGEIEFSKLPLLASPNATLTGDGKWRLQDSTMLTGFVEIDGDLHRSLAVEPLLGPPGPAEPLFGDWAVQWLRPFQAWNPAIDISVTTPAALAVPGGAGLISADFDIRGSARRPVPEGVLTLTHVPVEPFPSVSGELAFFPDRPWEPVAALDARGLFQGYEVNAFAFGPLREAAWVLWRGDDPRHDPQATFWLVRDGWIPAEGNDLPGGDARVFQNGSEMVVVSRQVDDDSAWRGGWTAALPDSASPLWLSEKGFAPSYRWFWK